MKFLLSSLIVSLASYTSAGLITIMDSYAPPVTNPTTGAVWCIGATVNVEWDVSSPPSQITNPNGKIYLRYNGLIDLDNPLAEGFDILNGIQAVTVPNVNPSDGPFNVVLIGNSGNWSEDFDIENCPAPEEGASDK